VAAKTPGRSVGKKQRVTRDETEETVSMTVRRNTRAMSGTPAAKVGVTPAVARKAGRPRKDVLDEEEEIEVPVSPAKRGRKSQSPVKKK